MLLPSLRQWAYSIAEDQLIGHVAARRAAPANVPVPASAPEPASTPVVTIAVFGDDQLAGYATNSMGMISSVAPNEPQSLQALLQKQFDDTGITVENHATGGRAASLMNLLDGMDGGGPPLAQRLASTQASIVIISYGLNDVYGGETVSDFSGYLAQAIQVVRDANRTPILEEPSPTCDTDHPQLAAYSAAIDSVGKTLGVPVL